MFWCSQTQFVAVNGFTANIVFIVFGDYKVDLGTLKILVEAHGLRVKFIRPNDER
jgi:hypothetical protein